MKTDNVYLERISDAANQATQYIKNLSFQKFKTDRKTQSAVILQLIVIGEEAKKISARTKKKIPLAWKQIVGFRNKAVHQYFVLDLAIVWKTFMSDIPKLRDEIGKFIKNQQKNK